MKYSITSEFLDIWIAKFKNDPKVASVLNDI